MTGFQIFLCVITGIIAFFVLILSIPVKLSIGYDDKIRLSVKYLFVKINILPLAQKQKKKKPEKTKEKKPPKKKQPKPEETEKTKKPNPIIEMVKANGYDGMMVVIGNLGRILASYGGKLFKSVSFDRIDLRISVGTGDSASTAIKYGEVCQRVFPVMGFICSEHLVKKYNIQVEPDFLANNSEGEFYCDINLCLRKIINSTVSMVFRLLFGVVIKFITGAQKKTSEVNNANNKTK